MSGGGIEDDYINSFGLDAEAELKEVMANPAARLIRKNLQPSKEEKKEEINETKLVGEIVEKDPVASTPFIFNVPKYDLFKVADFQQEKEEEEKVDVKVCDERKTFPPPSSSSFSWDQEGGEEKTSKVVRFEINETELNKKLEWTCDVDFNEKDQYLNEIGELRFDFEGNLISPYTYDLEAGLIAAQEGDLMGLNNHGKMAYLPGYSLPELITLLESVYDKQIIIALRTIIAILTNRQKIIHKGSCVRYKIDYQKLKNSLHLKRNELLKNKQDFILSETIVEDSLGFGFGVKRVNEYFYRSLMLHERLILIALRNTNSSVVDLSLIALTALLCHTPSITEGSWDHSLMNLLGNDEEEVLVVPHFLTSRRSVLRRENLDDLLLTSADSDLSHGLMYAIASSDEESDADENDVLDQRRCDPLLSILLWGENALEPELLKLVIARMSASVHPHLPWYMLRLLQALMIHSSFCANLVHEFMVKHLDQNENTCIRILVERYINTWLPRSGDAIDTATVIELLRFVRLDSMTTSSPLNCLLKNKTNVITIDSLVWKVLISFFDFQKDQSTGLDIPLHGVRDCLKLAVYSQNDLDSGCPLLPLYEIIMNYYSTPTFTETQLTVLTYLMSACQLIFIDSDPKAAMSFASILSQIGYRVYQDINLESKSSQCILAILKLWNLILSSEPVEEKREEDEGGLRAHAVSRHDSFIKSLSALLSSRNEALSRFHKSIEDRLRHCDPKQIEHDTQRLGLLDYHPFLPVLSMAPAALVLSRDLCVVSEMSRLLRRLPDDAMVGLTMVDPKVLKGAAREMSRYILTFPGRPRYGINTSDYNCFSLTNPLLDSWVTAYLGLAALSSSSSSESVHEFWSLPFALSTARELLPDVEEESWNVLTSLACGYCYEECEEVADALSETAPTPAARSKLLATTLSQVMAGHCVGVKLSHLGNKYSDSLREVGEGALRRSVSFSVSLSLESIWLYELIETLSQTDLKLNWSFMEELHGRVICSYLSFLPLATTTEPSFGRDGPLLERLREEWNVVFMDTLKSKLLPQLSQAVVSDTVCPRLRCVWLWLLTTSSLCSPVLCPWYNEATLNLCHRILTLENNTLCHIPLYLFQQYGSLNHAHDLTRSVTQWKSRQDDTQHTSILNYLSSTF